MPNRELALEKAREVVEAWQACLAAGKTPGSKAVVDIKTEEMIEVLLGNFEGMITPEQVYEVFTSSEDGMSDEFLRSIPDAIVPIAVMREILHTHKVNFNPKNVENWRAFVQKYGKYIMAA